MDYCNEDFGWGFQKFLAWSKLPDYTVNGKFRMEVVAWIDRESLLIETPDPDYCQTFKVEVELPKRKLISGETFFKSDIHQIGRLPW